MQVSATVDFGLDSEVFRRLRDRLLCELSQYSVWRDIKVMVAFDAQGHAERVQTQRCVAGGVARAAAAAAAQP